MKILILANNDIGLYKFRKELIEELIKDHTVYICLPNGEFIADLERIGCKFIDCKVMQRRGTNPVEDLKLIKFYKQIIADIKPDIIFTYTIKPNIYGGMASAHFDIPYVANITGLGSAIENGGVLCKIVLFLYRYSLRKAQKVFFQNIENRDFMLNHHIVKQSYDMIPGSGVNLTKFTVTDYPNDSTVRFALISRIMKQKGIEQYIDTAKVIKAEFPNTEFHVCGFCEEEYENTLQELNKDGTIIYHGLVRDIANFLQDIHCVIHPSYYPEGISNVLLEACASGRPIITTNHSGCKEVVEDGQNGYVVPQRDSNAVIDAVKKFLALSYDEKKKMGLCGRRKVEREFDRQIVINKYLDELRRIKSTNFLHR